MKHTVKKQRTPRILRVFMAVGKGWVCVGCHGLFFFLSCLPFLLSSLESKRGKEKNGDGFFLLDRKKRENFLEEGPAIYNHQQYTAQNIKESQGSEKALFVTLIIWFDFSLNVT